MGAEQIGLIPFYPGAPVPVELFTGRRVQLDRILQRGIHQTALGKPTAFFVQGEYGIGKSSIARFAQTIAERDHRLVGLYVSMAGVRSLTDLAEKVLQSAIESGVYDATRAEQIRNWLGKYIGKQHLFGLSIDFEQLRRDAPTLASPTKILHFLREVLTRFTLTHGGVAKGVFLVFDEINGIAGDPDFAQFLKSLVDMNALSRAPVPLLLMVCGIEERRRQLIDAHAPVDRIFDVVDIPVMDDAEMAEFFTRAFGQIGASVDPDAMAVMVNAAAGFPKIMHQVGYCVTLKTAGSSKVRHAAATAGVLDAAEEVGRRFVDAQVFQAIQSKDYQSILKKLANELGPRNAAFTRKELAARLSDSEVRKLDNFLQKLKKLNVIKSLDTPGRYQFRITMVQLYIWLKSLRDE